MAGCAGCAVLSCHSRYRARGAYRIGVCLVLAPATSLPVVGRCWDRQLNITGAPAGHYRHGGRQPGWESAGDGAGKAAPPAAGARTPHPVREASAASRGGVCSAIDRTRASHTPSPPNKTHGFMTYKTSTCWCASRHSHGGTAGGGYCGQRPRRPRRPWVKHPCYGYCKTSLSICRTPPSHLPQPTGLPLLGRPAEVKACHLRPAGPAPLAALVPFTPSCSSATCVPYVNPGAFSARRRLSARIQAQRIQVAKP